MCALSLCLFFQCACGVECRAGNVHSPIRHGHSSGWAGWELIVAGTAMLAVAPTPQQGKCQQDVFLASNPDHLLHAHDCALIVVRA
jgi:hypothetical protein